MGKVVIGAVVLVSVDLVAVMVGFPVAVAGGVGEKRDVGVSEDRINDARLPSVLVRLGSKGCVVLVAVTGRAPRKAFAGGRIRRTARKMPTAPTTASTGKMMSRDRRPGAVMGMGADTRGGAYALRDFFG